MSTVLPSLFIGSSSEGLDIAQAVEEKLASQANVQLWTDDIFKLGQSTLEGLIDALDEFDFAVMVVTPDDLLKSRRRNYSSPRDNVLFELGLFMGRIGRERTFILRESTQSLKLPSDLAGIVQVNYRLHNEQPQVGPACTRIARAIRRLNGDARRRRPQANVQTFDEVNAAFWTIKNNILKGELKPVRAELIQHSSERAFALVSALAENQTDIQLYLQHPETLETVCSDLKPRVTSRLSLYPYKLERQEYKGKLHIYLYKTPASFDGIRLWKDDGTVLIILGWYTYISDRPLKSLTDSKFRGSENPCFMIDDGCPDYLHFNDFFDELVSSFETQGTPPVFQMEDGVSEWLSGWSC